MGIICSALAAFYTRNFAEKYPDLKPPLLQVLSCANAFVILYSLSEPNIVWNWLSKYKTNIHDVFQSIRRRLVFY